MTKLTNQKSFTEKVLNGQGVQVVQFYADWSGTCQMMVPVYKDLQSLYSETAAFYLVDIEEASQLKTELGVTDIPAFLFYRGGEMVDFANGLISKSALIAKMENLLRNN